MLHSALPIVPEQPRGHMKITLVTLRLRLDLPVSFEDLPGANADVLFVGYEFQHDPHALAKILLSAITFDRVLQSLIAARRRRARRAD